MAETPMVRPASVTRETTSEAGWRRILALEAENRRLVGEHNRLEAEVAAQRSREREA